MATGNAPPRAIRGLVLGFTLSFLNLVGAFLALMALGGLGEWTNWQFIGFFGLLEIAFGLAFIVGPNVWRLPVAEANTSNRTAIRLAASTVFIPHWAAGAKVAAGLGMFAAALVNAGVGPATLGLPVLILAIAVSVTAISVMVARLGVARPDLDVVYLTIKRPRHEDYTLPGISIGGMLIQLVLNIGAFPAVKLLPPSVLYRPELGPSPAFLWGSVALAALSVLGAWVTWRGRIAWHALPEQQREAEELA